MENLNEVGNEPAENEESDSGDSIFITQKPVPAPVRSKSSPHLSLRSTPISPSFLESESSNASEPEYEGTRRKKHLPLPNYNFPFLKQRKSQLPEDVSLCNARNRAIHYHSMAGFFKCVDKMWPDGNRSRSFESSLPTIYFYNEEITPITEDENSDEKDVKIIDKKQFVYSIKPMITKSSQPWFKSLKNKAFPRADESASQERLRTRRKLLSASNKPEGLSQKQTKHLESCDSDATVIDDSELFKSRSKNASITRNPSCTPESTASSAEIHRSANQELGLFAMEDSDDTQSQSILQCNNLDMSGSAKKTRKEKRMEDDGDNQDTALSQESCDLFDNLKTNGRSSKSQRKNDRNHLKTINTETTSLTVSSDTLREVNEDAGLPFCPNDDAPVQKKKKKKKHKNTNGDQENTENVRNSLDSRQMLDNGRTDGVTAVEKETSDRRKAKKKQEVGDCNDKQDLTMKNSNTTDQNISSKFVESRGKSEAVDDSATATQSDESVSARRKKRKVSSAVETVKESQRPVESSKSFECTEISSHMNQTSGKHKKKKKSKEREETRRDGERDLETTPVTESVFVSSEKEVNGQSVHEDTGLPSCPNVEDVNSDTTKHKKKKKKKKKHKKETADLGDAENRTNSLDFDLLQMPDNEQTVVKEVSDMSERKRKKHKKKRVADGETRDCNNEQDEEFKALRLNKTEKNGFTKMIESQERPELLETQSNKLLSLKKKKRKLSSIAETMENANTPFLQSTQSQGADGLGISTNSAESAETNRLLPETELGNEIKTTKNTSEVKENSRRNESKDRGDDDCVKRKKKKKKSKDEGHQPDTDMTQRDRSEVEERAIFSPNASERKKKKKSRDIGEGGDVEASQATELEQTNVKRKKKNMIEDVDQCGEMSTPSGRKEKSSRTKVKKRLYNPNAETLLEEF